MEPGNWKQANLVSGGCLGNDVDVLNYILDLYYNTSNNCLGDWILPIYLFVSSFVLSFGLDARDTKPVSVFLLDFISSCLSFLLM